MSEARGCGLTDDEQAWLRVQLTIPELVGALGYAEVLAVFAAGLGVRLEPTALVWRGIESGLAGPRRWQPAREGFPSLVRRRVRAYMRGELEGHALQLGQPPTTGRLAEVQVGDLRGLEQLAHRAAEMGAWVRANDDALVPLAVALADRTQRRLAHGPGVEVRADARALRSTQTRGGRS